MDDYISRKSVTVGLDYIINGLNKLITDDPPNDVYTDIKNQVEEIKRGVLNIPPANVQPVQWIPCSERLPEDVQIGDEYPIVIFCTKEKTYTGFYEWYRGGRWWTAEGDYVVDDVIAWRELPEPYRKGAGNEVN